MILIELKSELFHRDERYFTEIKVKEVKDEIDCTPRNPHVVRASSRTMVGPMLELDIHFGIG